LSAVAEAAAGQGAGAVATPPAAGTLRAYCIGHVPPRFAPALPFAMLCPQPLGLKDELVIDDHRFGPGLDGAALAEYSQLFGLQDLIEAGDVVADRLYLFQYRKFVGFRAGGAPATAPWVRIARPAEAAELFPTEAELRAVAQPVVVGSIQPLGGSIAQNYAQVHAIDDLVGFAACLGEAGMDAKAVSRFATFQGLIPSPALCLIDTPLFLHQMRLLRAVWQRFARDCAVPRQGYQRRVAGYLLERLHSHLLCEGLRDGSLGGVGMGHRYVVLDPAA
jgi:hypothetical protein